MQEITGFSDRLDVTINISPMVALVLTNILRANTDGLIEKIGETVKLKAIPTEIRHLIRELEERCTEIVFNDILKAEE